MISFLQILRNLLLLEIKFRCRKKDDYGDTKKETGEVKMCGSKDREELFVSRNVRESKRRPKSTGQTTKVMLKYGHELQFSIRCYKSKKNLVKKGKYF